MVPDRTQLYNIWLKSAIANLDMADAGLERKHPEHVFFHCQQALEKLSKGIYILLVSPRVPHVHSISDIIIPFEDQLTEPVDTEFFDLFEMLSDFYKGGRYPAEFDEILYSFDRNESEQVLAKTKEAFQWLLQSIPKLDSAEEDQAILSEQPTPSLKP